MFSSELQFSSATAKLFHLERFAELSITQQEARQLFNLPEDKKLVGIVGRLTHVKNHAFFLEGLKQCRDIHAVIVGDGELENDIRQQVINLDLNERVHFLPTQKHIEKLYRALDVLAVVIG